jgi:hypothetical protein
MAMVAITLNSCLDGMNETSPFVYVPGMCAYRTSATGVKDTIVFAQEMQTRVGDTLRVPMVLYANSGYTGFNTLTKFTVTSDTSAIDCKFVCDSALLEVIQADSRPEEGYLHFEDNYIVLPVLFLYVSKKVGDYEILFSLASTASQKYSPNQTTVKQKIVSAD